MASSKKKDNTEQPSWLEQKLTKTVITIIVILILFAIIVIMIAGYRLGRRKSNNQNLQQAVENFVQGEEGKVTTVTQASLEKVVAKGRLYTAEYPYNGIVAVYNEGNGVLKYHVAYEGTVKAGIDVSKIQISLDEDKHLILIQLPELTLEEPLVNAGTLEYIFEDNQYNTETVAQEAYRAAVNDLKTRAAADPNIISMATKTAKMSEKAFIEPWVEQIDPETDYTIVVLEHGEVYK